MGETLYTEIAQQLQLDLAQFDRDRNSDAALKAINSDLDLAQSIGITGTPFFALNGQVLPLPFNSSTVTALLKN